MPSTVLFSTMYPQEGQRLSAQFLNQQIYNKIVYYSERNFSVAQARGVTDIIVNTTSWELAVPFFTVALYIPRDNTSIRAFLHYEGTVQGYPSNPDNVGHVLKVNNELVGVNPISGAYAYRDILGVAGTQNTRNSTFNLSTYTHGLPKGYHTFSLYINTLGENLAINLTNTVAEFRVQEENVYSVEEQT